MGPRSNIFLGVYVSVFGMRFELELVDRVKQIVLYDVRGPHPVT